MTDHQIFSGVEELLAAARARLHRLDPPAAAHEIAAGALLVDIRPERQRHEEGEIPGALVIERNQLEWRLDPGSPDRVAQAAAGRRWIVVCSEGYTSSLAADALNSIGVSATDIVGGYHAWAAAGLPTTGADGGETVS
jgi:rhodanese-related sulfurtransferase